MSVPRPFAAVAVVIGLLVIATTTRGEIADTPVAAPAAEGLHASSWEWSNATPPAEFAQEPGTPKGSALPALAATVPSEQPPSPAQTMRVFNAVEPWIRAWRVPAEDQPAANTGADGQPLDLQWGVCINLRLHGQFIGRGVAMVAPDSAEPAPRLIARAAAAAIRAGDARLPVPNDLMRDESIKQLTPDIQISLELAGAPIPVNADTWTLVDTTLAPGLDGVAVRIAESDPLVEFPSAMLMANIIPQKSIRAMIATAIGEGGAAAVLDQPRDLREKHAVRAWRFRVAHLAQTQPGSGPSFLFRGAQLIDQNSMTTASLRALALAGAKNLYGQFAMESLGKPRDLVYILASLGVAGVHKCGVDPQDRETLISLNGLSPTPSSTEVLPSADERDVASVAARAIARDRGALGMSKPKYIDPDGEFWRKAGPILGKAYDETIGFSPEIPKVARGIVAWALVVEARAREPLGLKVAEEERNRRERVAESAVRRAFAESGQNELVSMMPWLGWAEMELADLKTSRTGVRAEIPSAPALREMRSEVWKHQLDALDAGTDGADMVGGIVFTSGHTSPLPNWQCVRPLAFMATMLGDERLTEPNERALELAHLLHAFRFLRQLQVDDSCGWMYPNPEAAIGGIRAATWDHTMPPDATSLTLLAAVELLKSMDKIAPEMAKDPSK